MLANVVPEGQALSSQQEVRVRMDKRAVAAPRAYVLTFALLSALTLFSSRLAIAQSDEAAERVAAANQLFSILSKDILAQMTDQVLTQAWPPVERDLTNRKIDAGTVAALRAEFARIQTENMADVMKGAPAIYARHFTAPELRQLTAFYGTPVGQKALKEMPQIMAEAMEGVVSRLQDVMMLTQVSFNKILREKGYIK